MLPVRCISRSQELKLDFLTKNLKNLLVRNDWTYFHIILQKCSFDDPLPRLFKPMDSSKNMAARGQGLFSLYIYIENFKNLLVRKHWTDLNIILQKCSFGDPLPRLFEPFGFVKKHGRQGVGLIFPIYLYRKLKKSSCQKPLEQFRYNFAEMFLWWSSTKIVQAIWIRQKTWPPRGEAYFPSFSSPEPKAQGEVLWSLTIHRRRPSTIFKQHLLLNHWLEFDQTSQEWSLVGPLSMLFKWFQSIAYLGHRS